MYPAYLDMIETVYQNYFDVNGRCKTPNVKRDDIYNYLTSEPPQQGNRYFDPVDESLAQSFQNISKKHLIAWNIQQYYLIDPGKPRPEGCFLTARVVANIDSQTTAIKIACQLHDYCKNKQFPDITQTIYQYKILLGSPSNKKPVKLDKIVIYNDIPLSSKGECLPISRILAQQMKYLSRHCSKHASLPQFVWQPSNYSSVGFGQGIAYGNQIMAFSEPRADCIYRVIAQRQSKNTSLNEFQNLLSKEFIRHGLSGNIPFINDCKSKASETKWLIS